MNPNSINSLSLYIGNTCNLRCAWCYDQAHLSSVLDINRFSLLFNKVINHHIKSVTLIGGEPFLHPNIEQIISMLNNQEITIATNGILLSNSKLLSTISNHSNVHLFISIKGFDDASMYETTGTHSFSDLSIAINNLRKSKIEADYSYSYDYVGVGNRYRDFLAFCEEHMITRITISDIRPYINERGEVISPKQNNEAFQDFIVYLLEHGLDVTVKIQNPFCVYSDQFVEFIINSNRLVSSCSVKRGGAIFLNSELELVLCHSCYDIIIGRFEKDFNDYTEMCNYHFSPNVRSIYNRFRGCPQQKCVKCSKWYSCGGGCILNWRENGT